MSFRRLASCAPRTAVAQRWWGASSDRSVSPARGTVHTVIALERLLVATAANPTQQVALADFTVQDWHDIFSAATSEAVSNARGCHTFVISDWSLWKNDTATMTEGDDAKNATTIPFPIMNVVTRVADDFEYKNHIYNALRKSIDTTDLMNALVVVDNNNNSCKEAPTSLNKKSAPAASLVEVAVLSPDYHKDCSMLPNCDSASHIELLSQNNVDACERINKLREEEEQQNSDNDDGGMNIFKGFSFHFFPHVAHSIAYQNSEFVVLTNLKPVEQAGHLLIVPKRIVGCVHELLFHQSDGQKESFVLLQLGDAIASSIAALNRRRIAEHRDKKPCDGFSVVIQQNKHAGQTVAHLHVHVIALTRGAGLTASEKEAVIDPDAEKSSAKKKLVEQQEAKGGATEVMTVTKERAEELEEEERRLRQARTPEMMVDEARTLMMKYF